MTKLGKLRCGCDCKNKTEADFVIESEAYGTGTGSDQRWLHYPCLNGEPAPIRYALIFECFNPWPLWHPGQTADTCSTAQINGVAVLPACVRLNTIDPGTPDARSCGIPPGLSLTFPITEVRKACVFDWFEDLQGAYWQSIHFDYLISEFVDTYMDDSALVDIRPGAVPNKFPPYRVETGTGGSLSGEIIEYGTADLGSTDSGYSDKTPSTLWLLDTLASPAFLEWTYDCVLARMNNGAGKPRPRYEAVTDWQRFGRNPMVLTNPEHWPSLRPKICVGPAKGRTISPCQTQSAMCGCCDPGEDVALFAVNVSGEAQCLEGTHLILANRVRKASQVPCGVRDNFPADAPCGAWQLIVPVDNECPSTGTGTVWGDSIYLLIWCVGAATYIGDVYCYNATEACYEKKGAITVTGFECIKGCRSFDADGNEVPYDPVPSTGTATTFTFCCTFIIGFTIPQVPCCCSSTSPLCCVCASLPTTATVSSSSSPSFTVTKSCDSFGTPRYTAAGPVTICSSTYTNFQAICLAGVWTMSATGVPPWQGAVSWDGDCSPIVLVNTNQPGCTITMVAA